MNVTEFKCWLDGFKHSLTDAPTKDQWETILKKLNCVREFGITSLGGTITSTPYQAVPCREDSFTLSSNPIATCTI